MNIYSAINKYTKQLPKQLMILPLVAITFGLYIGINAEIAQKQTDAQTIKRELINEVDSFKSRIKERLIFYSYGLTSLDSLVSAVGRDKFDLATIRSFSRSRNFQVEFPGVRGFGFIENVALKDLNNFAARQRLSRPDNTFTLKNLSSNPDKHFIIRFIEPENKNASAVGLNIGSEARRKDAAILAVQDNAIRITAPITLVQANKSIKQGFLVLMPFLFETSNNPPTLADNWGWTYAPIVIDEVVESIGALKSDLVFSIVDVTDGSAEPFYQSHFEPNNSQLLSHSEEVSIFGRIWSFEARVTPAFLETVSSQRPHYQLFQSTIIAFLVAIILFFIHFIMLKRIQLRAQAIELAIAKEIALKQTNKKLESLVNKRTNEIKKSDAFKQAVLLSSAYPIIATDTEGIITLFNPAAEKLLGYSSDEMIGKETPQKFHLEKEIIEAAKRLSAQTNTHIEPGFDVFKAKARDNIQNVTRWTYVSRDNKHIPVTISITALLDIDKNLLGYLGIAYDLTNQLEREEALAIEKVKAEQATVAKSDFLANMSHEIRTPLNGIQGALQLLEKESVSKESSSLIDISLRSTKILSLLINDILDLSKVEAGKITLDPTAFNVGALLDLLQSEFAERAEQKDIQLSFENKLEQQIWIGDDLRIRQILVNLISNAIKFTHSGEVSIKVAKNKANMLVITVQDTGIGMNDVGLSLLFKRFEQADQTITRRYGGSGLGMSISHSLIELMEGKIVVSSEINVGTTFTLYLPLEPETSETTALVSSETISEDLSEYTILVAEDNAINQIIIQSMLSVTKANVSIVDNGEKALNFATQHRVDLILMDIQMPVMDGLQACSKIKALHPEIPIIALTANVFADDIEKYKKEGFDSFMAKPFERTSFIKMINSFFG